MIALCEHSLLKVFKETKHGYFLEDSDGDEILLPFRSAPEDLVLDLSLIHISEPTRPY